MCFLLPSCLPIRSKGSFISVQDVFTCHSMAPCLRHENKQKDRKGKVAVLQDVCSEHFTPCTWLHSGPFRRERGHQSDWQFFLQNHEQQAVRAAAVLTLKRWRRRKLQFINGYLVLHTSTADFRQASAMKQDTQILWPTPPRILKMERVCLFIPGGLLPSRAWFHFRWTSV